MRFPVHRIQPCGDLIFAAQGAKIHVYGGTNLDHISTWKHPDLDKLAEKHALKAQNKDIQESSENGPPAKRQRVEGGDSMEIDGPAMSGKGEQRDKEKKSGSHNKGSDTRASDQPIITELSLTSTKSHLVAVSGHDKTIWVFEIQAGGLKQLSRRAMPKRPCSVLLSPEDKLILSADKFGDVYTLPLIPSSDTPAPDGQASPASSHSTPVPSVRKAWKPQATSSTVHSQRNLESLRQQEQAAKNRDQSASEKPTFEHTLIIGHVSLLTSMCLAQNGDRRYIITADRDEHIRVSRYVPQAHVIEEFCLGHEQFVNALVVPDARPELLISGGGDDSLFVWNWETGTLLSKFDILGEVRRTAENADKIAVRQLSSAVLQIEDGSVRNLVFVLCEGAPGVFVLEIPEGTSELARFQTITFTGNPLHLACDLSEAGVLARSAVQGKGKAGRILVVTDAGNGGDGKAGVWAYRGIEGKLDLDPDFAVKHEASAADEPELTRQDLQKLLYGAESLRKQQMGFAGEEDTNGDAAHAQNQEVQA